MLVDRKQVSSSAFRPAAIDIVNREYEENGSFRCDFVATKERDRDTGCIVYWQGFTPAQDAEQLAEGSLKHNKGIWWMPWR